MSYNCPCIKINIVDENSNAFEYSVAPAGIYGGQQYFTFPFDGGDVYIYWNGGGDWILSTTLGGAPLATYNAFDCPLGTWTIISPKIISLELSECTLIDCCMEALHLIGKADSALNLSLTTGGAAGVWNNAPYWQWIQTIGASDYYYSLIRVELEGGGCQWQLIENPSPITDPDVGTLNATLNNDCDCPIGFFVPVGGKTILFAISQCRTGCVPIQDRTQRYYDAIRLPIPFQEEDRGWKGCCECRMLVLASATSDTWKNDVTSAWIKLSDPADTVTFLLVDENGNTTTYTPPVFSFPNEENAFYTTIKWADVLASDGAGCYDLKVEYNISGILGQFTWGEYTLRPYSIQNALRTARIRVKFNLRQEVEGINFTDANVEDTIRFYGFIGERQPKTEIDNLIYQDRTMKSVVRENLDQWSIMTDPLEDCMMYKLTDLYLLSENEMWISDYNIHNHSYRIQDIPVILEESPEIDYLVKYQRKAVLTALVGRKLKNRRTYY